ncbi:MAG: homoserine dehydrogenase [Lachnospiraceae bacterium]|nr:homoserine dehydrogenase [Lachnospiraceae bacterium]
MIKAAILGYGTVGSGIFEILNSNKETISKKTGNDIEVKYVLDLREFPGDPVEKVLVHDFDIIVNDKEVDIVAEAMGGVEPAYTFAKKAIESGKSFCTSNKELVAKHGAELLKLAKEHKVNFLFEASVGGGIPIIRPLNSSLTPEYVEEITGILNGTTNYMMTKMSKEGLDFDSVLKDAQDKGYAERNPEADIEGYDACRKIAILSSIAYGKQVDFEDIHTEGITNISDTDMVYAAKLNKAIKLLGTSYKENGKVTAMVAPMLVDNESPLYAVNDVFNAILVKGNMLGEVMFYGKGAGKLATASAVVSDIIEEAKNIGNTLTCVWEADKIELNDFSCASNVFFVRVNASLKDKVSSIFGDVETVDAGVDNEYAFITKKMTEGEFADKTEQLGGIINKIRVKC